jgi:hypothetical protein
MEPEMPPESTAVNSHSARTDACMSAAGLAKAADQGGTETMGKPSPEKLREDREKAARVTAELAALGSMTTADLAAKFEALTGQPARSRNKVWLRKRVAWHLQAAEYGGLSDAALAKIDELIPLAIKHFEAKARLRARAIKSPKPAPVGPKRDPRLPAPGTTLQRAYGGRTHEVTVHERDFEYGGERYRSLSKVAREITGTP